MRISLLLLTLSLFTYYSQAQYTLKDSDVTVENGIIYCDYVYIYIPKESTHLIIPEELDGQKVIGIDHWIFSNNGHLKKVSFPKSLLFIQENAFTYNAIEELTLPPNLKFIGSGSFASNAITNITIPKSVTYIGGYAFSSCKIESAIFEEPSSIKLIDEGAFHNNYNLNIVLPENSNHGFTEYYDSNGKNYEPKDVIREKDFWQNAYYSMLPDKIMDSNDLILKNDTIIFGDYFKNTIIPDSINGKAITTIGKSAFLRHSIETLSLPDGLQYILEEAFAWNKLQNLIIPKTVKFLGEGAFKGCYIQKLIIPKNITKIPDNSFSNNYTNTITLSVGLDTIGAESFYNNLCSYIEIPHSVSHIGKKAFIIDNREWLEENGTDIYDKIELPHPAIKEGYSFTHWENENGDTVKAIEDFETSYSAQFIETDFFQVSGIVMIDEPDATFIDLSGDFEDTEFVNSDSIFSFKLNAGRSMILTPNKEGYIFQPENYVINDIQTNIGNIYFSASRLDYQINFLAGDNGTIKGESHQNIIHGYKTAVVEAIPNIGYQFEGWFFNEDSLYTDMNPLTITVTQDYNLIAIFNQTVGVLDSEKTNTVTYPNPVKDNLYVQAEYPVYMIKVYNSLGKCVLNQSIKNQKVFEIQNLSQNIKGIAYIQLIGASQQELIKVIVE